MNAIVQTDAVPRAVRPAPRPAPQVTSSAAALSRTLVAALDPAGAAAEALRELRSQLVLRWFGEKRTLAVLGARAEDDADTVVANLAIAMAQLGEPTLVIDANLRAPRQHELFGLKAVFGLSDLLRNRDVHDDAILPVQAVDNLHVLCAGAIPTNPQELVSRTPFQYLMKTLPDRFRAIIVATPPVLSCADAQIIAARTQGCVLVTRRHHTRLAEVEQIKDRLASGRATLVGGVVRE
jgi:chain length determinant protein tyrosine kinase EpsG